ncbi:LysR substrate-binding domain-containing protein [Trinickia dinghuensis]|uniref:LysR family transcriptional regulator n=1 Tax=Trinickia dinghuensis TaxID=2291023 RepID=A0A3D8JRY6_9BURK|nr:LysR substrate-binding domain-containing protein [Trinickia dinghuensis]RDU95807.1 LysR family transcriptional regulator [Trinickia dinghuensis]
METRISFRHVSCFLAIARERNLGRAAERLNLTQPAVSKTLTELESLADVRLVERGRHGARLTPAGEHFLRYAVGVAQAMESASAALHAPAAPPVQILTLGALPTVASGVVPDALLRLRERHPQTGVRLHTGTNQVLLSALKAGHLDCVIGRMAEPATMQGLSFELLYAEPLVMAVRPGHPLLGTRTASPQAVLDYPLVVAPAGTVPRLHTDAFFDAHALHVPATCTETLSISVARLLARRSDAVWITPEFAARDDLVRGELARLPLAAANAEEPVGLLRRSAGEPLDAVKALAEILRELTRADSRTAQSRTRRPRQRGTPSASERTR